MLAVAVLLLIATVTTNAQYPTVTGWILEVADRATTVGQLASSVYLGRNVYLAGGAGVNLPTQNTSLESFLDELKPTGTQFNFVNPESKDVGSAFTLNPKLFPPPWTNVSKNATQNASLWEPVSLPIPVIGANNMVVIGSSIFIMTMCNALPEYVTVNASLEHDLNYLRTVIRIDVVTESDDSVAPPKNHSSNHSTPAPKQRQSDSELNSRLFASSSLTPFSPRVQISHFQLDPTVDPRFNASCVAHGNSIYIYGGVQLHSNSVTDSVAAYDTVKNRYSDSAWTHEEAVMNPGLASDDSFLYIAGGRKGDGTLSQRVFAHHMPSYVLLSESGYPGSAYDLPFVAVADGNIVITGSPYGSVATWSMRFQNAFPQVEQSSVPTLVSGSLVAVTTCENVSLRLFDGWSPSAGSINTAFYKSTATLDASMFPPMSYDPEIAPPVLSLVGFEYVDGNDTIPWVPNSNGQVNMTHLDYPILWENFSFRVLLSSNDSVLRICNLTQAITPATTSVCTIRVARSSRCDDSYTDADLILSSSTVKFNEATGVASVGPFSPIPLHVNPDSGDSSGSAGSSSSGTSPTSAPLSSDLLLFSQTSDVTVGNSTQWLSYSPPLFAMVCFSSSIFTVDDCRDHCLANFYTPLNMPTPFIVRNPTGKFAPPTPAPLPTASPAPQGRTLNPSATRVKVFIGIGSALVVVLLVVGVVVYRRNKATSEQFGDADYVSDDDEEPKQQSLLFSWKKKSPLQKSTSGSSPRQPGTPHQPAGGGQPALLDGKYRVLQRLGKGSFSVVYLVERPTDGQRFALKYVQISDDTDRHEAMKECEVVHKLQGHPNVIQLADMFMSYRFDTNLGNEQSAQGGNRAGSPQQRQSQNSPRIFDSSHFAVRVDEDDSKQLRAAPNKQLSGERYLSLVMEYHEKGDLGRWVRRQKGEPRVPEGTVLSIAFQVLSVLNYMHHGSPPIIHRDLKPENILLSSVVYENMSHTFLPIVVTDFGLSRVMDKTFCETGVGSLPYVAPECWQRCYSTKVDIWAVGCILYAVCAKRVESENVKVMFSESARPDFHKKLFQELHTVYGYSEMCTKFIMSLLEVDPEQRPTATQSLKRLKKRKAIPANYGSTGRREVSELEPEKALEKLYDSGEMGKDAQCEFYVPKDTFFPALSSGWGAPINIAGVMFQQPTVGSIGSSHGLKQQRSLTNSGAIPPGTLTSVNSPLAECSAPSNQEGSSPVVAQPPPQEPRDQNLDISGTSSLAESMRTFPRPDMDKT